MTTREIVRRVQNQGAVYEVLACGHLGLVYLLPADREPPTYPTRRKCGDCERRRKRIHKLSA